MNDIEQMVRESLQARSQDVEPTPALWDGVQQRVARRRLMIGGSWALAGAAAALVAVAVVPGLLAEPITPDVMETPTAVTPTEAEPTEAESAEPVPTDEPVDEETAPAAPAQPPAIGDADGDRIPDHYVSVEGNSGIVLRETATDALVYELQGDGGPGNDGIIVDGVAVRPGSTPDHLIIATAWRTDGFEYVDVAVFQDGVRTSNRVVSLREVQVETAVRRSLAWDEFGNRLAWMAGADLTIASIDEIAKASASAAGNDVGQAFTLDGFGDFEVHDWSSSEGWESSPEYGWLSLRGPGPSAAYIQLRIDADGTIDLSPQAEQDRSPLDEAVRVEDGYAAVGSHAFLGSTDGNIGIELVVVDGALAVQWASAHADGSTGSYPSLPGNAAPVADAWVEANSQGVLVGTADGVWFVADANEYFGRGPIVRQLPSDVRSAVFVPRIDQQSTGLLAPTPEVLQPRGTGS